jgi:hypothetical protein
MALRPMGTPSGTTPQRVVQRAPSLLVVSTVAVLPDHPSAHHELADTDVRG